MLVCGKTIRLFVLLYGKSNRDDYFVEMALIVVRSGRFLYRLFDLGYNHAEVNYLILL